MLYTDIPDKFPIRFAEDATGIYIRPIPEAAGTPTPTDAPASLELGFPPETFTPISGGGVPPAGADMNGILNQISAWCQWQAAGNATLFDATFAADIGGYPKYALIASTTAGILWQSTVDSNSNNPDVTPTGWTGVGATEASVGQIQAGSATGVYISPGNLATAMGAASGESIMLPNGRIQKRGVYSTSLTVPNQYTVTYATPFPNGIVGAPNITGIRPANLSERMPVLSLGTYSSSSFTFHIQGTETGSPSFYTGASWFAEGY